MEIKFVRISDTDYEVMHGGVTIGHIELIAVYSFSPCVKTFTSDTLDAISNKLKELNGE